MRTNPRAGPARDERGFTLIELMVVILIIGILIAIALPTYLGSRKRAADRAVQTDLRSGLVAGMAWYTINQDYSGFTAAAALAEEPGLGWVPAGLPQIGEVAIQVATPSELLLVALSKSGGYFCVAQISGNPVTMKGGDPTFTNVDTVAECNQGW